MDAILRPGGIADPTRPYATKVIVLKGTGKHHDGKFLCCHCLPQNAARYMAGIPALPSVLWWRDIALWHPTLVFYGTEDVKPDTGLSPRVFLSCMMSYPPVVIFLYLPWKSLLSPPYGAF